MSYRTIDQLTSDVIFGGRNRAAATEQAETFHNDQRPDYVALAQAVMLDAGGVSATFTRLAAAGPGIGDRVDNGDGTIDQSLVTDADLLALTQSNWPVVAGLYFTSDGAPI